MKYVSFSRVHFLAVLAFVLSLLALQVFMMRTLDDEAVLLEQSADRTSKAVSDAASASLTLTRYESVVGIDKSVLPSSAPSGNKFYSYLLETVSAAGLGSAVVSKNSEEDGGVSFIIEGEDEFDTVLRLLELFRVCPYIMRMPAFSVEAVDAGGVEYSICVDAKIGLDM